MQEKSFTRLYVSMAPALSRFAYLYRAFTCNLVLDKKQEH